MEKYIWFGIIIFIGRNIRKVLVSFIAYICTRTNSILKYNGCPMRKWYTVVPIPMEVHYY